MKVTFDSNAWQRVVRPDSFPKDARLPAFRALHTAVRDGRIEGFISETVGTLEAVRRVDRAVYFSGARAKTESTVSAEPDGRIKFSFTTSPDHSQHPGLPGILSDTFKDALALGIRLMAASRIGLPKPEEFINPDGSPRPEVYAARADGDQTGARTARFHEVGRVIEGRDVGIGVAKALAENLKSRSTVKKRPWYWYLSQTVDRAEERRVEDAIAEWADGDAVASHIAFSNDIFCTEDAGKSAGLSVLDPTHRTWLATDFGIRFENLISLAQLI